MSTGTRLPLPTGPMRDLRGDAAVYFDPHRPAELAAAILSRMRQSDKGSVAAALRRHPLGAVKSYTTS